MRAALVLAVGLLVGCAPSDSGPGQDRGGRVAFLPDYLGVTTELLVDDLVTFRVEMTGARGDDDVIAYAECAAAQYSLIRGFGFARHLRTTVDEEAGIWRADAVYTVSPTLPRGTRTIDAEVKVADCREQGIPTV